MQKAIIESGGEKVFAESDFSPYAKNRDTKAAEALPCEFVSGLTIHPPSSVQKSDGAPYTIFTPFMRTWKSLPEPGIPYQAPTYFPASEPLFSLQIPSEPPPKYFPPSELEAHTRLESFLSTHLYAYNNDRDRMDLEGTSELSPYLRFGLISANTLTFNAKKLTNISKNDDTKANLDTWLNELIWRDFYYNIMDNFPFVLNRSFKNNFIHIPWRDSNKDLDAWKNGLTGYPVVDAGMRQLRETGWMHNRARMITASFLTKDLLINWQEGEKWFMEQLIDGDPASNNGGWQWSAGTGTDAAPYFRIFNSVLQGKKFDPFGTYVRRWLPELTSVPEKFIHSPWEMPLDLQSKINLQIGKSYPKPIVNHSEAREKALAAYKSSRVQ